MEMATKPRERGDPGLRAVFKELDRRKQAGEQPATRVELAAALGIKKQAITRWLRVPPARAVKIESLIGIPRETLRPDIFCAPQTSARKSRGNS